MRSYGSSCIVNGRGSWVRIVSGGGGSLGILNVEGFGHYNLCGTDYITSMEGKLNFCIACENETNWIVNYFASICGTLL